MAIKYTTEEFIVKCRELHEDCYLYTKTIYEGSHKDIIVTCKIHGDYICRSHEHIIGKGICPKCSKTGRKTTEEFVKKAKDIHGELYGYDKVSYTNNRSKVIVTCYIHGDFQQMPKSHLRGSGCPKCSDTTKTTADFINDSKRIYGTKYGYDRTDYVNNCTKLILTCKNHGDFLVDPSMHLSHGSGCPKCSGLYKTNEEFVQELIKARGTEYDYSKVDYKGASSYITIICKTHGEFRQKATNHLHNLNSCPKCSKSGFNPLKRSQFYIYEFDYFVGYGVSNNPYSRHQSYIRDFRSLGVEPKRMYAFYGDGDLCKKFERFLKDNIIRTEVNINGLITENAPIDFLKTLLDMIDSIRDNHLDTQALLKKVDKIFLVV